MNSDEIELLFGKQGNKYYVLKNSVLDLSNKNIEYISDNIKKLNRKLYFKNKLVHRLDGEAFENINGGKSWYQNGLLHRENGPAVEEKTYKAWLINGKVHREDGPAVEYINGNKEYWLNGNKISEEIFYLEKELRESIINNNISKKNKI